MPPLNNSRYEKVAFNLFKGMIQKEAVIDAGFSPRTADLTGFRLIRNDKIQARIQELHKQAEKPGIMSVGERKERLSEVAREGVKQPVTAREVVQSIAELNKMDGSYAPEKHAILGDIQIEVTYIDKQISGGDTK